MKNKRALFIIVLVILSWADLSAQLLEQNVLYHKNGSIIKGEISFQSDDTIKITTQCNNYFVFSTSELLRLTKERIPKVKHKDTGYEYENHSGFYNYTTIGLLTGKSEFTDNNTFSFHTSFGYQFNNLLGIGIETGVEKLKTELVPILLSIRSDLLQKTNSPTINLHIGYSVPLSKSKRENEIEYDYEGGLCLGFNIGATTIKSKNRAFTISVGYQYQVITEKNKQYYYWWDGLIEKNTYQFNKIAIRIGFLFR